MDYFVLGQIANVQVSKPEDGVVLYKTDKIPELANLDYIQNGFLVSDRLKLLFELYMPYNKWILNAYLDLDKSQDILKQAGYDAEVAAVANMKGLNEKDRQIKLDKFEAKYDQIRSELKETQSVFWRLDAAEYIPAENTVFGSNGFVSALCLSGEPPAPVFKIRAPEPPRLYSVVVHLSVAESMMRRKYLGVNLIRV